MNNINNIGGKSKKFTKPKKSIKPENKFTKTLLDKLKTFLSNNNLSNNNLFLFIVILCIVILFIASYWY